MSRHPLSTTAALGVAAALLAGPKVHAGPAGGVTGEQQRSTLQRMLLVCEDDPQQACPNDPSDPDYCIPGFDGDRVFHEACNPGLEVDDYIDPQTGECSEPPGAKACVPYIADRIESAEMQVRAREYPATANCVGEPGCVGMEVEVQLSLPNGPALSQIFRDDGFTRDTNCQGTSDGVRISDWFPLASRECAVGIDVNVDPNAYTVNFEGMIGPGNETGPELPDPRLLAFEDLILDFVAQDFPRGSVVPTTMLDEAAGGLAPGNTLRLGAADVLSDAVDPGTGDRTVRFGLDIGLAAGQPQSVLDTFTLATSGTEGAFGSAVALDGQVAAIAGGGVVTALRFENEVWVEEARFTSGVSNDGFGSGLVVSGNRILVGACFDDSAYVYQRTLAGWQREAILTPWTPATGFGCGVALADGVAALGTGGSVYVFRMDGSGSWQQDQEIVPSSASSSFGTGLSAQGNEIAVGDPSRRLVQLFEYDGTSWAASHPPISLSNILDAGGFGSRVELSGNALAAAASGDVSEGIDQQGAVYMFRREAGVWSEEQRLTNRGSQAWDRFGSSLSLDGDLVVAGTNSPSSGARDAAYAFRYVEGVWAAEERLLPSRGVDLLSSVFPTSVAVSGSRVLAGDPRGYVDGSPSLPGGVYGFELPATRVALSGTPGDGSVGLSVEGLAVLAAGGTLDEIRAALVANVNANVLIRALGVVAADEPPWVLLHRTRPEQVAVEAIDPAVTISVVTACSDGIDNDEDGLIDDVDPGCADPQDASERTPLLPCDNGVDDDLDGATDYHVDRDGDGTVDFPGDPGCKSPTDPSEELECSDGLDNDGDGDIDLADAHCTDAMDDRENLGQKAGTCAAGLGLLPVVLIALGSRRRIRLPGTG